MKDRYQYIHFIKTGQLAKTSVYTCRNNASGEGLGQIRWYGPWRQYCFFPTVQVVFSAGCLADIQHFLGQLAAQRNAEQK